MVLLKIPQNSQENTSLPGSLLAIIPQAGGLQPHSIPNLVQVFPVNFAKCLKVVPATFLLVCLKQSTCETRKNVFLFLSESSFHF